MKLLTFLTSIILILPLMGNATCFPKNSLFIRPLEDVESNEIGKSAFNQAIDKVEKYYAPIVKKKGFNLVFNRLWSDGTVNSDTSVSGKDWVINSYGGLARYKGMNSVEAYAAVACHELGHHMGGAPLYSDDDWAAVEGEADYWATKECMKAVGFTLAVSEKASLQLAKVLADLGGDPVPDKSKVDTSVVQSTYEDHPVAQCRLDTYLNGLACPTKGDMSQTDPKVNSCYSYPSGKTYGPGSRPRCWFAP